MFEKKLYVAEKHEDQLNAALDEWEGRYPDLVDQTFVEQTRDFAELLKADPIDQPNALFNILVEHMGMPDSRQARYEFVERYSTEIPRENWFLGVGGTGWKLWFDSMDQSFRVAHETGRGVRPENENAANAALNKRTWLFLTD